MRNKDSDLYNFSVAIGLEKVDNLNCSSYFESLVSDYLNERASFSEIKSLLEHYYEFNKGLGRVEEADKVSIRVFNLLSNPKFDASIKSLVSIHKSLFDELLPNAGKYRSYNIKKSEDILNGDSVIYEDYHNIEAALKYEFEEEKKYHYDYSDKLGTITHLASFISGIWQIHPFGEGNTRAIAVFLLKFLKSHGFTLASNPFADHSLYFRGALVRASYSSYTLGVKPTTEYLEKFLRCLLLGEEMSLPLSELALPTK